MSSDDSQISNIFDKDQQSDHSSDSDQSVSKKSNQSNQDSMSDSDRSSSQKQSQKGQSDSSSNNSEIQSQKKVDYDDDDDDDDDDQGNTQQNFHIPHSIKKLQACINCLLVNSSALGGQDFKCPYCQNDQYVKFEGLVCVLRPKNNESWLLRKIKRKIISDDNENDEIMGGPYALKLMEE